MIHSVKVSTSTKTYKVLSFIHRYGIYYSIMLFLLYLLHIDIYPNSINFWVLCFCFSLNSYFIYQQGIKFAIQYNAHFTEAMDQINQRNKNK